MTLFTPHRDYFAILAFAVESIEYIMDLRRIMRLIINRKLND